MVTINSLSGGRTSCMMSLEFPAQVDLFALVEQQCAIYDPANRWWTLKGQKQAYEWIRTFHPGFWSTAEDDRTLICLHELSKLLANRPESIQFGGDLQGLIVTCAHQFSGLTNPHGKKASKFDDFDTLISQRNYLPNARKRLCTQFLKVETIYHWCAWNYTHKHIIMRIGFRADEVERTVRLYFSQVPTKFRKPNPDYDLTASFKRWRLPNYLARWWEVLRVEELVREGVFVEKATPFNIVCGVDYRTPEFPLIEHGITEYEVSRYWSGRNEFPFPEISNCVGCFHHRVEQLNRQWHSPLNRGKMEWYAREEERTGKLFGKTYSYRQIQQMAPQLAINFNYQWTSCDSGGCTD